MIVNIAELQAWLITCAAWAWVIIWGVGKFRKAKPPKLDPETMTLDEYSEWAMYRWEPNVKDELTMDDHYIMGTGLPEEVGELLGLLKRWKRDKVLVREKVVKEAGDVLYYLITICRAHGIMPSEIIRGNVEKVEGRIERGTMHGEGDDR